MTLPVEVHNETTSPGFSDWLQVSVGNGNVCGIRANGLAYCWGFDSNGALGNGGGQGDKSRPYLVAGGFADWKYINNTCGIRTNGTLYCWGPGSFNDTYYGSNETPIQIQDSNCSGSYWSDWIVYAQSEAGQVRCGIRANGEAWCWGLGGLVGDGTNTARGCPTKVQTDTGAAGWTDWTSLQGLANGMCGTRANGTMWCWGDNDDMFLGTGAAGDRNLPTAVAP